MRCILIQSVKCFIEPHRESWRKNGKSYHPVKHRCQFSWYCDGKPDKPKNIKQYDDGFLIFALMIVQGKIKLLDITDSALWYHADYVRPDSWHTVKRLLQR